MSDEASPRPWRIADGMQETIVDDRNNIVANASNNATAALIVDAVNHIEETKRLSVKLYDPIMRAEAERDRLRAELADKTRNYEDVIAHHQRTEEHLRDIVKRLVTIRETLVWRKDEKTGLMYYDRAIDEEWARKTIEEAKAAVKEDKE